MALPLKPKILPIPTPPCTQALKSTTFKPAPLDGSLTIPELYDWHQIHTPNHPLFEYADDFGVVHVLLWPEVVQAIHRAARRVITHLPQEVNHSTSPSHVVGIFAPSGL